MRRYLPITIIGVVFLLAIGSGLMLFRWKQPPSAATAPVPPTASTTPTASVEPDASVAPVTAATAPTAPETPAKPEPEALHVRGNANASVTLEEYGDFQCLPCGAFFPVLAKAEEDFGDRLRVVFRHKPLKPHEHAVIAACAAEAAGLQGRFWEMHDLLFQNSWRWTKGVETVGPDAPPSRRLESKLLAMPTEVREVFLNELSSLGSFCAVPAANGAFYLLLKLATKWNAMQLVERLIREYGVAVIPGTAFGAEEGCYLRVAYGALEKPMAAEGLGRLVRGLKAIC
jgi:hypothetical protein